MSDAVTLALTRDLLESIAEEMAQTCMRAAASPNVKERRDLSAAVFDGDGTMLAHAAHIPVHLGAMPMGVRAAIARVPPRRGDVILANDPYEGGTHLPDVTALAALPGAGGRPAFLVAIRAHHADVGGAVPGSMAPQDDVHAEGVRIPPVKWLRGGREEEDVLRLLLANTRHPEERRADLAAQRAALSVGLARLAALARTQGLATLVRRGKDLVAYARRIAEASLAALPDGEASARVRLAGESVCDAIGRPAWIRVRLAKRGNRLRVDFAGTSGPVGGGLNATEAVTASAVYHLVRSLCPAGTPCNDGLVMPVSLSVPLGSCLRAPYPAPVASGNVETSQRIVDALWLAAARLWPDVMPAPGAGTMSNWTLGPAAGSPPFPSYYETVPAGAGAGPTFRGSDAIQQHMTNTRNTPVEVLEARVPLRVRRFSVRWGTGGRGRHRGGDGVVREFEVLAPSVLAWAMTRHDDPPPGVAGGGPGKPGRIVLRRNGRVTRLPPRGRADLLPGDVVTIETPGGGGWGRPKRRRG